MSDNRRSDIWDSPVHASEILSTTTYHPDAMATWHPGCHAMVNSKVKGMSCLLYTYLLTYSMEQSPS